MIPIRTQNGAAFECEVDPSWTTYANLNFLSDVPDDILFHLSLRLTGDCVVINRKTASGWQPEQHVASAFPTRRFVVSVAFDNLPEGGRATLSIDGVVLGQFGPPPRPRWFRPRQAVHSYPDLHRITRCQAEGAIPWETIRTHDHTFDRMWDKVRAGAGLILTDRMEVAERLEPGVTRARHAIVVQGGPPLPLRPAIRAPDAAPTLVPNTFALPDGIAALLLPGRIWLGTDPAAPALVQIVTPDTGQPLSDWPIHRHDLTTRLTRLTQSGALAHDDLAALQGIEHVHHSGVWQDLPRDVQAALQQAAQRFGLTALLPQEVPADLRPAQPEPGHAPLEALTADLSRQIDAGADRTALAAWLSALPATQDAAATEHLALTLCPTFCEHDALDLLHDAIRTRGLPPVRASDDVGYVSLRLPFQLLDGDAGHVADRLHLLATRDGGWLATSAVGWVAQRVADPIGQPVIAPDTRLAILRGVCALIAAQARNPWGRAPCHRLMDGLLAWIAQLPRLPPDLRAEVCATAIAAYGLSPRFWTRLPRVADRSMLSAMAPDLATAAAAFARLGDPQHRPAALATLAGLECRAAASAALDLVPVDRLPQDAPWHRDTELRRLFHPDASEDPDFDVGAAIARSQPTQRLALRAPPFDWLERRLGEAAFDLIRTWQATAAPARQATLLSCLADAQALARPEAGHVGLAVCLSLLAALHEDPEAEQTLLRYLPQIGGTGAIDAGAAALRPALTVLDQTGETGARARRALGLPPVTPNLCPAPTAATALFNTVVVVMSCQPHLHNRVPALRAGWLADLTRMGIPHLIVMGGIATDDTRAAGVTVLDAPDDYEGLPQKSLVAIAHVQRAFPGQRMLKIDDDCFLDVDAYFLGLSFLRHDYYGRPLARARGQMDRTWHMAKSASARGRHELDKSPEPSTYADGGSGYLLSPRSIDAILAAADSAEGQRLIQASFMEDKLIGDLLALQGIQVAETDYRVHVLRHARPGGIAVPKWENTCLPFRGSGIKLAHLDGHDLQATASRVARTNRPASAKIWSTLAPARLGAQSHALDLLSPPARLDVARAASVAVVACLRNEMAMLPAFFAHYRALGVSGFLIADNGSDDGTTEYLMDQPDVALFTVDADYRQSHYGVLWQQALLAAFRHDRWTLLADADELLVWQDHPGGSLPDLLQSDPAFRGCDAVRVFMLDMYPQGRLSDTDFTRAAPFDAAPFTDRAGLLATALGRGPFSNARTYTSATRHRLMPGSRPELFVAQKIALLRYQPWMRLSDGLHYAAETRLSPRSLLFGHFKYNATFRAKAVAEVARAQHFNNAEEYRKYLAILSEGRETLYDPAVSVRWTDSPFVQSVLSTGAPPAPPWPR